MNIEIRWAADHPEYETDERYAILEIANDASDPAVSIARALRVTTAWHKLVGTDERYLIVEVLGGSNWPMRGREPSRSATDAHTGGHAAAYSECRPVGPYLLCDLLAAIPPRLLYRFRMTPRLLAAQLKRPAGSAATG